MRLGGSVLLILAAALQLAGEPAAAESVLTEGALRKLERVVIRKLKRMRVPGAALAVTEGAEFLHLQAFGVRSLDSEELVDADTLFHIASTHKAVTATLAALLIQDGQLSWDSTVGELRPDWTEVDPWLAGASLRRLLNMTGGFVPQDEDEFYDRYGDASIPENLVEYISSEFELQRQPGVRFSYSNLSAALAGYLTTYAASGAQSSLNQAYARLLREALLKPLGMDRSTIFVSEARAAGNLAAPHIRRGRRSLVAPSEDLDSDPLAPAGSLKASAAELAAFVRLHARRGLLPAGRLLEASAFEELWRPSAESGRQSYALGWDVKNRRGVACLSHTGEYDNFSALIAVLPDFELGLVLLANSAAIGSLHRKVLNLLIREARRKKTVPAL